MAGAPNAREASLTAARDGPMVTGQTDLAQLASHSPPELANVAERRVGRCPLSTSCRVHGVS